MPEWLEAIRTEVPDNQLKEFREVLRYIHCLEVFVYCSCYSVRKTYFITYKQGLDVAHITYIYNGC